MVTADQEARQRRMGRLIREARERQNLSQVELAVLVVEDLDKQETLDQSMISRYEHGKAIPEPSKRRGLERVLDLPAGELQRVLEPEASASAGISDRIGRLEEQMDEVLAIVRSLKESR